VGRPTVRLAPTKPGSTVASIHSSHSLWWNMKKLVFICLLLVGVLGCGQSEKQDNSRIQSPGDQPIGPPKPAGGGKTATIDVNGKAKPGVNGANEAKLPKVEFKNAPP